MLSIREQERYLYDLQNVNNNHEQWKDDTYMSPKWIFHKIETKAIKAHFISSTIFMAQN